MRCCRSSSHRASIPPGIRSAGSLHWSCPRDCRRPCPMRSSTSSSRSWPTRNCRARCASAPWRVLEDGAVDYGLEKDPELLRRCQELARQVDPEEGLTRLHRLMLRRGMQDREIAGALVEQARARHSSLCPHCYAFVPCTEP